MFTWTDFWAGIVLPAALVCLVLLTGWRLSRRRMNARDSRSWAGPLALAVGFMGGFAALFGRPELPPLDAVDWLFYLAPVLAVLGTFEAAANLRLPARLVLVAAAVWITFLVLTWTLASAAGQAGREAAAQTALAAAVGIAALAPLDALAARVSAARMSAILLAVAAPATVVLVLSGSLRVGQIGSIFVGCAAGALVANLVLASAAIARGMVLAFGTLLAGLVLCGHVYAELNTTNAILLAAAPNMAWLAYLVPKRLSWLAATLAQLGAVLAVSAIALLRAWWKFLEDAG